MRRISLAFLWVADRSGGGNGRKARQGHQEGKGAVPAYKISHLSTFGYEEESQMIVYGPGNKDLSVFTT